VIRRALRLSSLAAGLLLAAPAAAGPTVACPDGPDPLRFRPEQFVAGTGGASTTDVAAAVDASDGQEWVAIAFLTGTLDIGVALSGNGGCTFDAASGGFAPTLISAGGATSRPSIALRADAGTVLLAVAWLEGSRAVLRATTATDGTFGAAVELDTQASDAPEVAITPPPTAPVIGVAWSGVVAGTVPTNVSVNAGLGDPAAWSAALLVDDLPWNPPAPVDIALAADGAGAGGGGFTLLKSSRSSRAVYVARASADGGFGPLRLASDGRLDPLGSVALATGAGQGAGPADSSWNVLAWSGREAMAPMRNVLVGDALLHEAGVVTFDLDRVATGSNVTLGATGSALPLVSATVGGGAPGATAFLAWPDGGEIHLIRRPVGPTRPNLTGGCADFRATGLSPARTGGIASFPALASLGADVVMAFADDRRGSSELWIKRSDAVAPAPDPLTATPSACPAPPSVQLAWSAACDVAAAVVEVGTAPGGTDFTRPVPGGATYALEGLEPATTYYLRVRLTDSAGNEATSAEVSADTPSCAPANLRSSVVSVQDACPFGGGGGNGAVDPGERVRVQVLVENVGADVATAPRVSGLSRSPYVTVTSGATTLPDLPVGGSGTVDLDFDVSATAPCGATLELLSRMDVTGAAWWDLLAFDVPGACVTCRDAACAVSADPSRTAPRAVCRGTASTLDGTASSASGCAGVLVFDWWNGATYVGRGPAVSQSPNNTTTYRLVATCTTDFDCTAAADVTVTVFAPPPVSFLEAPPPPHCIGDTVTLTATTPDPAATFAWLSGETTADITATASGVHEVTVTDSNGCTRTSRRRLDFGEVPPADAGPDVSGCGPRRVGTPGFPLLDYEWSPPDGLSDPRAAQPLAAAATPTVYTLTVTDPTTGCAATDDVLVEATPLPLVVGRLRVGRSGSMLTFSWEDDALASSRRVYADLDAERAADANAGSATAALACEGVTTCDAPLPPDDLVFYQAVGVCLDGTAEGPNR
jgi:hypothetical protein